MKKIFALVLGLASLTAQAYAPTPSSLTKVFEYSCTKRFFEGEGVRPDMVNCIPYQHLGFYQANYSYYLFESRTRNNFQDQARTAYFPGSVCGLPQLDRFTCESSPRIAFGVSEFAEGPYVARIQLTATPMGATETYGYVALPDQYTGECEQGLEKSYVNVARLGSVRMPFPTNFPFNTNLADDYAIRPASSQSEPYELTRIPANSGCDGRGFCRWPDGRAYTAASATYLPSGNAFCVIPAYRAVK